MGRAGWYLCGEITQIISPFPLNSSAYIEVGFVLLFFLQLPNFFFLLPILAFIWCNPIENANIL